MRLFARIPHFRRRIWDIEVLMQLVLTVWMLHRPTLQHCLHLLPQWQWGRHRVPRPEELWGGSGTTWTPPLSQSAPAHSLKMKRKWKWNREQLEHPHSHNLHPPIPWKWKWKRAETQIIVKSDKKMVQDWTADNNVTIGIFDKFNLASDLNNVGQKYFQFWSPESWGG